MVLVLSSLRGQPLEVVCLQTSHVPEMAQALELTTDLVANTSDLPGATLSDALDTVAPATGTAAGYLQRLGFVNAASSKIGTTFAGAVLQAAVTWSTAAQVPPGNRFTWDIWASTGGACGGKASVTGSSFQTTGAPSAGAAHRRFVCSRADVIAALPLAISVGLGGLGSAGAFRNVVGDSVPAASGAPGAASTVGSLASAFPGGFGFRDPSASSGLRAGSSGGGTLSAGTNATSSAAVPGGNPGAPAAGATGEGGAGCIGAVTGGGAAGAEHGGASTTGSATQATSFQPGGTSAYGGSAGGWGATWDLASSPSHNGGPGGGVLGSAAGGVSAVATSPASAAATDGADGVDGTISRGAAGGAGGGSAKVGSVDAINVVTAIAGDGGDGGFPGGGAGGGGDAALGTLGAVAVGSFAQAGDGGKGGDGLVLCTID